MNIYEWSDIVKRFYLLIYQFLSSKFCRHIGSLLLSIIAIMAFCHGADAYSHTQRTWMGILSFVFIFGLVPILLLVKHWKIRPLRWYVLVAAIVILFVSAWRYYSTTIILETDISNYLYEQSDINKTASLVMPQKEDILDADQATYAHIKTYDPLGFEVIELRLWYNAGTFPTAKKYTEEQFAQLKNALPENAYLSADSEGIQMYGHSYVTYTFVMDDIYYAVAYSHCTEDNSTSYILISSTCLSYVSPNDLLESNDYQGYI